MRMGSALKIELLGKPNCHLCEIAEGVVEKVCARLSLPWEKVNIEDHPDLHDRFKEEIPVLLVDGRKLFKYRTSEPDLMKSLIRRLQWGTRMATAACNPARCIPKSSSSAPADVKISLDNQK